MLNTRILPPTEQAHSTPLLIKNLLLSGVRYEASQEIVYRDISRYDYATFNQRICRLANVIWNACLPFR
jgi:fatty-acyl-CoA synthase